MPEWDAEVAVDEQLVRALLGEQFPEVDASSARLLGQGWDNAVWVVEEAWAFRFPRREIAIAGVRRELDVLPRLAPLLPVAIPEPGFVGEPSDLFPWPFFGAPLLAGVEPAEAGLGDAERTKLGEELGHALRVLHAPATIDAVDPDRDLPVDFNRRADMPFRVARLREKLATLPADLWRPPSQVEEVLASAEALPPSGAEALVHGDLHLRHVLVDAGGLTGLIDWGDLCRADPAIDLVVYWSLLPTEGRTAFVDAYGEIEDERLLRSRVLSLYLCSMLALYARDIGRAALERECVAGLDRAMSK
jgi:aminoglycoside phosphotransferase (APT) family kinase protein